MKPEREMSLPDMEEAEVEINSKAYKVREKTLTAMMHLTLAFTTEMNMNMIAREQTDEWPNGFTYLVVKELFEQYKPNDNIS